MGKFLVLGFFITQSALAGVYCSSSKGESLLIRDTGKDTIAVELLYKGVEKKFYGKLNLEASDIASVFQVFDYDLKGSSPAHLVVTSSPSFGGGRGGRGSFGDYFDKKAKLTIGTQFENYFCY